MSIIGNKMKELIMVKQTHLWIVLLTMTHCFAEETTQVGGECSYAVRHDGKFYHAMVKHESLVNTPTCNPIVSAPPLSAQDAAKNARKYLDSLPPETVEYEIESINMEKFLGTDWWYYVVGFRCKNRNWEEVEPYRSLIASNNWDTRYAPCVYIIVLMNGVVPPLVVEKEPPFSTQTDVVPIPQSTTTDVKQPSTNNNLEKARQLLAAPDVRVRKAVSAILKNRTIQELSENDLLFLCQAYNDYPVDDDRQDEVSKALWEKDKGSKESVRWRANSLCNKHMNSGDTTNIINFVDQCKANRYGNKFDMLILKAHAVMMNKKDELDMNSRKEQVIAIIVEAYKDDMNWKDTDSFKQDIYGFLKDDRLFRDYFSEKEKAEIIETVRMKK